MEEVGGGERWNLECSGRRGVSIRQQYEVRIRERMMFVI